MTEGKQLDSAVTNSAQYDNIVSKYNTIYDSLNNHDAMDCAYLEVSNFHQAVAPYIQGKRVLDLACGSGHYSLLLLEWGAASVVGVDISEGMVTEARKRAEDRKDIEFVVGYLTKDLDLSALGGPFEVVVGTWLLNYASSKAEMTAMFRAIKVNCSGHFFGLTIPPPLGSREELDRAFRGDWAPFGTDGHVTREVDGGFAVYTALGMPCSENKVGFDNFYLRNEVFEESCTEAGLSAGLEWLPLHLDADLRAKYPLGKWNRLVLNPHFRICHTHVS